MTDYRAIMSDANNLYDGYLRSIATSKWKTSTQRVMDNYLRVIFKLQDELYNQTYKSGIENEFILHERGKIRPITSLQVKDRIVRHVLCDHVLTPKIKPLIIYDNGASTKGRGLSFCQKRFEVHLHRYFRKYGTNKGFILFGDFTKFYDNIQHAKAKRELLNLCENDEYMQWLFDVIFENFLIDASKFTRRDYVYLQDHPFDKVWYRDNRRSRDGRIYMEKSVNIGDQLAQDIGIYYPYRVDNYVKIVRAQEAYSRYMDDFYDINPSKEELKSILAGVEDIVADLGLYLNQKKTRIVRLDRPFTFLQMRYRFTETGRVLKRINPKTVTSLRQKLNKLSKKVYTGEIEYNSVEQMFKSEMGNYYKEMSRESRENLIDLYEDLFDVDISFRKGKMLIERKRLQL